MKKNDNVYLRENINSKYNKLKYFNPNEKYLEFKNWNISFESDYLIYDEFRNILLDMELDKQNIGTSDWNPFRDFVKESDCVLIKPNLVRHMNPSPFGSLKSTITNVSVIRPILDYSIKALGKNGRIIIADAPVQECEFNILLKKSGLGNMVEVYNEHGVKVELYDLRKNQNSSINTVTIDLERHSYFNEIDAKKREYLVTNYTDSMMKKNHGNYHHKYVTSDIVLKSDVIINVFKPKCHRIAGITASMKNLIGIISKKECLPHYSKGSINENGDEYQTLSLYRKLLYKVFNCKNKIFKPFKLMLKVFNQLVPEASVINGCWYKNDTIWRTVLDVNSLIDYTDKKGNFIFGKKQRVVFNVGDMIISGEKNGPLHPRDKYVGCLICGFNRKNIDSTICKIMGFNKKFIKYLNLSNNEFNIFSSKKRIVLRDIKNRNFKPADGWKGIENR